MSLYQMRAIEDRLAESTACHWSQDGEDSDVWATQCGHYFRLDADSPSENDMKFCCYCGKPLVELEFEDEELHP